MCKFWCLDASLICLFDLPCVSCVQLQTNVLVFCVNACYYDCFIVYVLIGVSYVMMFRFAALMHNCLSWALKFCLLFLPLMNNTFSLPCDFSYLQLWNIDKAFCLDYILSRDMLCLWCSAIKNTVKISCLDLRIFRFVLAKLYSYISWVFAGSRTGSSQGWC